MSLNPYTWLGGLLVIVFAFGTGYLSGRHDGTKITAAKYETAMKTAAQQATVKLEAAHRRVDEIQQSSQQAMVAASTTYQKDLQNVQARKDEIIANLHAGAVRLRDPGPRYPLGGHTLPEVGAAPGRCDGQAGGELSEPAAEFLVGLAAEADAVVHQLDACQQVIRADRDAAQASH